MSPLSHESWKEQLPGYLLGALTPGEKSDLEHHIGGCAECQAELRWLEPTVEALAESVEQIDPPRDMKRQIMGAVAEDLTQNPPHPEPADPSTTHSRLTEPRRGLGWMLRPAAIGAMATVLVIGAIGGYLLRGDDSTPSPTVTERTIAGEATNGARATMVSVGDSGRLEFKDLEKPERGRVYQAWVLKGETVLPTDALFVPRRDGTATAAVPDMRGVDAVMISTEPVGGSDAPTTTPVITFDVTG